jgi:hypothetical protein
VIAIVAVIVIEPLIVAVHVHVNSPVIVIDKVAASSIAKLVDA